MKLLVLFHLHQLPALNHLDDEVQNKETAMHQIIHDCHVNRSGSFMLHGNPYQKMKTNVNELMKKSDLPKSHHSVEYFDLQNSDGLQPMSSQSSQI
jgi:hypothetical protein